MANSIAYLSKNIKNLCNVKSNRRTYFHGFRSIPRTDTDIEILPSKNITLDKEALFESTLQVQTHSHPGRFMIPYELWTKQWEEDLLYKSCSLASGETQILSSHFTPASQGSLHHSWLHKNTRWTTVRHHSHIVNIIPLDSKYRSLLLIRGPAHWIRFERW